MVEEGHEGGRNRNRSKTYMIIPCFEDLTLKTMSIFYIITKKLNCKKKTIKFIKKIKHMNLCFDQAA